jgi:hypothetical protein
VKKKKGRIKRWGRNREQKKIPAGNNLDKIRNTVMLGEQMTAIHLGWVGWGRSRFKTS